MKNSRNIKIISSFILLALAIVFVSLGMNSYQIKTDSRATDIGKPAAQYCNVNLSAEPKNMCNIGGVLSSDVCQFKPGGDIAVGWTKYSITGNPRYENTDYSSLGEGTIKMTPNGNNSYKAGAYTQADVTPGKVYCASWQWGAPGPDQAPYQYGRTLGIDPSGGTDPNASTVIWGNTHVGPARHLDYPPPDVNVDVKTVATGNRMTIFYRVDCNECPGGSMIYIDGINLFDEGQSDNPPPTNVPSTPTATQSPDSTSTPTPTSTQAPTATGTNAPTPTKTNTPTPTTTNTPTPTSTHTPTPTPTATNTPTPTSTLTPTNTPTSPPTFTPAPTYTPQPTYAPQPTYTPQPTLVAQTNPTNTSVQQLEVNEQPPGITPWAIIAIPLGLILIGLLL